MREYDLLWYYIQTFLGMLTKPSGIAILGALLAMIGAAVTIKNARWVFLTLAIYFATIPLVDTTTHYYPLAFPLEQFRAFSRPLIYFFSALLLLPLILSDRGWRNVLLPWPLVLFFVFELTICLRLSIFGGSFRGAMSFASYALLLLTLGLAVSRWLQTFDDLYKLVWVISCVGGLVVLGTCYQLVVDRKPIVWNSRLTGITSNPQFLGIIIAYTLPFTCHLLTRAGGRKWVKPLLIAQITVTVILLVWTGSRTGALSTVAALAVAFHRRLGRFLVIGAVVFAAVLVVMPFFHGSADIAGRLLSTEDTRATVWPNLFKNIRENFWLGAAREMFETQESSYLSILGQFGIIGSLPIIAAGVALIIQIIQLRQLRRWLGSEAPIVDIVCGAWTAVAISSAFESLLVGVITFPVLTIYVFTVLTAFLLDWCRTTAAAAEYGYGYEQTEMLSAA